MLEAVGSLIPQQARSMVPYSNPVISGFAPDPSVVVVDGIFFLVTSSFHLFPGIPIYVSRDLREWTLIGNDVVALGAHGLLTW